MSKVHSGLPLHITTVVVAATVLLLPAHSLDSSTPNRTPTHTVGKKLHDESAETEARQLVY